MFDELHDRDDRGDEPSHDPVELFTAANSAVDHLMLFAALKNVCPSCSMALVPSLFILKSLGDDRTIEEYDKACQLLLGQISADLSDFVDNMEKYLNEEAD